MKTITLKLTGIAPLLTHNERLANPRDPGTAALKKLTTIKGKNEEQLEQIAELEWKLGLYTNSKNEIVMPADNILACLKEGARKRKLGKQVEAGVFAEVQSFPFDFDGPKNIEKLWKGGQHFDYRSVGVAGKRTMRARPIFKTWTTTCKLVFDPEVVSEDDLVEAMTTAGMIIGLCEKRPQLGRFTVTKVA